MSIKLGNYPESFDEDDEFNGKKRKQRFNNNPTKKLRKLRNKIIKFNCGI